MSSLQVSTEPRNAVEIPRLNLLDYDIEELRQVAESGGVLYWNHGGLWGKIPNAVLSNTLSTLTDWRRFKDRRPKTTIPSSVSTIHWGQTVRPQQLATALSAPPLRHRQPPQPQSEATQHD